MGKYDFYWMTTDERQDIAGRGGDAARKLNEWTAGQVDKMDLSEAARQLVAETDINVMYEVFGELAAEDIERVAAGQEGIRYYVSTVDRYNSGRFVGQMLPDSSWSSDIAGESESPNLQTALEKETQWVASATEDSPTFDGLVDVDTKNGLVWWKHVNGEEIVTEVSIDIIDEDS